VEKRETSSLKISFETVFLVKYVFALVAFVPAVLSSYGLSAYPARIIFVLPLAFWGTFCLTAAEVRVSEVSLQYRRFVVWKQVPYELIARCERTWNPWFAYLELTQFVPPWGRLYFVILRPAFGTNPKKLLAFINSRRAVARMSQMPQGDRAESWGINKEVSLCALMCFLGLATTLIYGYVVPGFLAPPQSDGLPRWLVIVNTLYFRAVVWPWAIGIVAFLLIAIIWMRFKNRAWILAFGVGTLLGSIILTALH
jgi:hypothetical protein